MSVPYTSPVTPHERIRIIDALRGFALLGILLMNIPYFSNPHQYDFNYLVRNEVSGPNYYTWWAVNGLFEGTMRALFSILFGAGCLLLLTRLERKEMETTPADIYFRRLLWLLLFGLFNGFILLWPGDILYEYAICGLFLYPFRRLSARHLFLCSLALFLIITVKDSYQWYQLDKMREQGLAALSLEQSKAQLSEDQKEAKEKWVGYVERNKLENLRKAAEKEKEKIGQQNYFGVFTHMGGYTSMFDSVKFYRGYFFDILFLLFMGMALYKWGVLTGQRSRQFYWMLLAGGYLAGLPASFSYLYHFTAVKFDASLMWDQAFVNLYQFKRIGLALGHLSALMLLYKYGLAKRVQNALAGVGQMAFTNYLAQTIICTAIFFGYGFGLFGRLERYETYYVVGAIWAFQIVFSNLWLRYFRFGPFEWAWRSLTYWRLQPMKGRAGDDEAAREPVDKEPAVPLYG